MNAGISQRLDILRELAAALGVSDCVTAQGINYRVTSVSADDVEFTPRDREWSENENVPKLPDDDSSVLQRAFLLVPDAEDEQKNVTSYKLPFREVNEDGTLGPVNQSALQTIVSVINGAMGGVEDMDRETLETAYNKAVDMLVGADFYEDREDAPGFDPANAAEAGSDSGPEDDDQDSLEAADPMQIELSAEATGTVDSESITLEADDDGGPLMGVIWGAGDHDLVLGGQPTPVRVPEETVPATFEALQDDVKSDDVTLGFDHPGRDSVAEQTGIVDIGVAEDVALTDDERHIVLTDSELTNDRAAEAAESGEFDDLEWSIVADVRVRRDEDGDPVTEDGRVVLDATRINRVDAVTDGAVDAASIERSQEALPDLKSQVATITEAADTERPNRETITAAAEALRASAAALDDTDMSNFDPDEFDDVSKALEAASDVIEDQEDELEAQRERIAEVADAFGEVLEAADEAVDVDLDEIDVTEEPDAAAQAVIDAQTVDLREEIADLEADLAKYETSDDDVEARAEELAGQSATDLRAMRNERAYEAMQVEQEKQTRGAAAAQTDTTGRADVTAGNDTDADELALSAMDGADRVKAEASNKSPAEYLREEYGIEASEFDDEGALRAEVVEAATEA